MGKYLYIRTLEIPKLRIWKNNILLKDIMVVNIIFGELPPCKPMCEKVFFLWSSNAIY